MKSEISFLIVTHRHPSGVEKILSTLSSQVEKNFATIVISNFYEESVDRLAEKYQVLYRCTNSLGVNRARNLGLKEATTPYVYFLDDDCYIPDAFFSERLLKKLKNENRFVGGFYQSVVAASAAARAYIYIQNHWLQMGRIESENFAYLLGGNCGGPSDLFSRFTFDEAFLYGGTETEMFLRASQFGIGCSVDTELNIFHDCRVSLKDLVRKAFKQAKGTIELSKRYLLFSPLYCIQSPAVSSAEIKFYIILYHVIFRLTYVLGGKKVIATLQWHVIDLAKKADLVRRTAIEKIIAALDILDFKH